MPSPLYAEPAGSGSRQPHGQTDRHHHQIQPQGITRELLLLQPKTDTARAPRPQLAPSPGWSAFPHGQTAHSATGRDRAPGAARPLSVAAAAAQTQLHPRRRCPATAVTQWPTSFPLGWIQACEGRDSIKVAPQTGVTKYVSKEDSH